MSIQRQGPSKKRKLLQLPVSSGPSSGNRRNGASQRLTRRLVSAGRL